MKKKHSYILYILLVFFAYKNIIYSWSGTISVPDTGEGGEPEGPPIVDVGIIGTDPWGARYSCKYEYDIKVSTSITINTYNKDNELTNEKSLTPDEKTLAGTAIWMQINENKTVTWDVPKVIVTKTTDVTYRCKSKSKYCDCDGYSSTNNSLFASIKGLRPIIDCPCPHYKYLDYQQSCPNGYEIDYVYGGSDIPVTDGEFYNKCQERAEYETSQKAKVAMTPSYIVKLQDSNDIDSKKTIDVLSNSCSSSGGKISICNYIYSVNKTCMNVKTAAVNYITNENGKCSEDEIEVKGPSDMWPYFVPLNTKNKDTFFISISAAGKNAKQSSGACKYVINNYSNYKELIIRTDSKQFTGDKSKDLSLASSGCYLSSVVNIPTIQKFYNEQNDNLKGYSFYYRQIDISNPFPNGVEKDSYWNDWYQSKNKHPELTESFNKVTYYTGIINADSVRNYNQAYKYTSWQDMNTSGLSNFITSSMRIDVDKKAIYKLGCGPLNKDWSGCKK